MLSAAPVTPVVSATLAAATTATTSSAAATTAAATVAFSTLCDHFDPKEAMTKNPGRKRKKCLDKKVHWYTFTFMCSDICLIVRVNGAFT